MKFREGDFIESRNGLIFDVKGFVHPPDRVVAFIRYFPDLEGERTKKALTYGKVYSLSQRYALLKERFPRYLVYDPVFDETLCEVPTKDVKRRFDPIQKLRRLRQSKSLDAVENSVVQLASLLKERADVPWNKIGITGSVMIDLRNPESDIDLIVYGSENCRKVHGALRDMLAEGDTPLRRYDQDELKRLFDFRSKDTETSFEDFVRTENRKVMQGKFGDGDYFMRFVRDWNEATEHYGQITYKNVGYARVAATIENDAESIFTPCTYGIRNVRILKGSKISRLASIVSFRGRFCEQARKGEKVIAQGKVELVKEANRKYHRLLLGNKPQDFITLQTTRQ
jgi:predicted nucleotidyltransferase